MENTTAPNVSSSGKIFIQIPKIMAEIEFIAKDRKNAAQGWTFRGIDDVYNTLHPIMAKHGVFSSSRVVESKREPRPTRNDGVMTYTIARFVFTFFADDGSSFETEVLGEASDTGDKSSNKAMAVAHKYALLQVFLIPTEGDNDPDFKAHEVVPQASKAAPAPVTHKVQTNAPLSPNQVAAKRPSEAQLRRLYAIVTQHNLDMATVKEMLKAKFGVNSSNDLTLEQYPLAVAEIEKLKEPDQDLPW